MKFQLPMRVLLLLLVTLSPVPAFGVTNIWISPKGGGNGSSRDQPINYYPDLIKWRLLGGDKRNDREVVMHFLPGEYLIDPINTETVNPSDWRITIRGEGARPEETVLKLRPNYPGGNDDSGGSYVNVIELGRNDEYIQRFVMENITIDGNWSAQTNFNSRRYLRAYKNSPVYVSARTGRIRNVIVRNYGAHGMLPQRTNDVGAGVEGFPLCVFTREEGQQPEDGDAAPWVVENCEATGFHGLFSGYSTTLMSVVSIDPATLEAAPDSTRRLIWFRGNQVRGNADANGVIGMGTAGLRQKISGRVTWSDSAILNAAGFNTDTGLIRWLDFTNLMLLDVVSVGYLGSAAIGQPYHEDYNISGNSVRLTGYVASANYRDFIVARDDTGRMKARPESKLALGRPVPTPVAGLVVRGLADDIRFADNWITTRAGEQFSRLGLAGPRAAEFWPVHRLPDRDPNDHESPGIVRNPATDVDLSGNSFSAVPFDFDRMEPLGGRPVAKLTEGSSPVLTKRAVRVARTTFTPVGTIERVSLWFTNAAPRTSSPGAAVGRFLGVFEVVCGAPTLGADGKFTVPVRLAIQPTPNAGLPGTQPLAQRPVFLEVLAGSLHPQKLSGVTDANGVAKLSYTVREGANGMDFFRAWMDYGQGSPETWDEYQDAWATANYAHGSTVGLIVDGDVADGRNGGPGRIRLLRTGDDDRPLSVQLGFATGLGAAELDKDFRLVGGPSGKPNDAKTLEATVEFPRGVRELALQVEALPKTARHGSLLTLEIKPGAGYAAGYPASGEVVIYSPGK